MVLHLNLIHFFFRQLCVSRSDNLGYLIVCVPESKSEKHNDVVVGVDDISDSIVAVMIDCGEAAATIRILKMIQQFHYRRRKIQVHAILSTHKHHDHTGGNLEFMLHEMGSNVSRVYGGAIERVPQCTHPLVNGDTLELPKSGSNDMSSLVEIEAVAVPAHTRGSLVYRLSCKEGDQPEFMFTGDTMFSAGSGVPFEADIGNETESQLNKSNGNTFVRAGLGQAATERCFAEILSRALPDRGVDTSITEKILIFPGHEYTSELLARQFQSAMNEACRWKNFVPQDFFTTVSQMYVALHRRSLPHNSGKLLLVPSTLGREIRINPVFRSLRRSGELVVRAVNFWYDHFCLDKQDFSMSETTQEGDAKPKSMSKTPSTIRRWNVSVEEVGRDVFTTVYTSDLESLIEDLLSEKVSKHEAAYRLRATTQRLNEPVVNKRAIPGFLPSDKSIYRGIAGLVLLGSRPSAMTLTDGRRMKLPPPIDSNSDRILISKRRLLLVLGRLDLLCNKDWNVTFAINNLWKEANEFTTKENPSTSDNRDVEATQGDQIELGVLKWVIYGVPSNQPSWFSKTFCMPCSVVREERVYPEHPATKMKQKVGDLVSHDVLTCLLCRTSTGCLHIKEAKEESKMEPEGEEPDATESTPPTPRRETESFNSFNDSGGDNAEQVFMEGLQSLMKEHDL